jgi:hypothetical protein
MARIKLCKEPECSDAATTEGYCRLHYLKNWKRLKSDKEERAAKRLNGYIKSVMRRNPDGYMDEIKRDIKSKQFDSDDSDGSTRDGGASLFDDPAYDEEIDEIIKELNVVKGY